MAAAIWEINSHLPDNRPPAWRDGTIVAVRNRENANVITTTGRYAFLAAADRA